MAGRLSNVAQTSFLRLRTSMSLLVSKHIVPEIPLPVNDKLVWDSSPLFPKPFIERIANIVGKYEALAWLTGGLSCFVGLGLLVM
ncbi:hypothetical protein RchiOBHm_Chr1g0326801 [Rosa chinensis]|uniref:Uncharacterized protein n=1 Tax=Rosa chinensis TaxID=74649 RepID=A0A2P6SAD2_ROSCH|nr:hypothetical protein RchiOBHm_Chr1g0326801 [Rosa chinensis]